MYRKPLACALMAIIFFLPLSIRAQDEKMESASPELLATGASVPPFSLPDIRGQQVDVGRYLGQLPVVLSFWSIYCDSCVDEMISLQKLEDKYRGDGLVIIAVNEDIKVPTDRIRRFLERLEKFRGKITYPLLYDESSRVFNSLGISTLPTLVLIDREGRIAGYSRGFDPEGEIDLLASVETLVKGKESQTATAALQRPGRSELITVRGKAALCGFFDSSGWRKSFSGSDNFELEMELTRDLSRRAATRQTITESMRLLGIRLFSFEPMDGCVSPNGIHLSRDPFDTKDPTSNLIGLINYSDFFETIQEQEMLIDETYFTSRQVRVSLDRLESEMESLGFLFEPLRITFTYVNMSRLDQKAFIRSLLNQSRFIGRLDDAVFNSYSTSQVFEVYTSSQGFADEILGMDFGDLQVFVEDVTPASLELEVWK